MKMLKRFNDMTMDIEYLTRVTKDDFDNSLNAVLFKVVNDLSDKISNDILKEINIKELIPINEVKNKVLEVLADKMIEKLMNK